MSTAYKLGDPFPAHFICYKDGVSLAVRDVLRSTKRKERALRTPRVASSHGLREATLFIFHDAMHSEVCHPEFELLAKWWMVGDGQTGNDLFPFEAQFSGPLATRTKARTSLTALLTRMKEDQHISRFKVRNSYVFNKNGFSKEYP